MWAGQLSITLLLLSLASRFPISRKIVTREGLPRAYREKAKSRARDFFGWTPQNPYYTPLCAVPPPFALDALRSLEGRPRYARQTPPLTALLSSATFAACSFRSVPVRYILVEVCLACGGRRAVPPLHHQAVGGLKYAGAYFGKAAPPMPRIFHGGRVRFRGLRLDALPRSNFVCRHPKRHKSMRIYDGRSVDFRPKRESKTSS